MRHLGGDMGEQAKVVARHRELYQLRWMDAISGVLLLAFCVWEIYSATQMPMTESYAGVANVWYVSPALLPLAIGVLLIPLAIMLITRAMRDLGAMKSIYPFIKYQRMHIGEQLGFMSCVFALICYVFLLIPNFDFILVSVLFLLYLIGGFYYCTDVQHWSWFKRTLILAVALTILALIFPSLLSQSPHNDYSDILVLVIIIAGLINLPKAEDPAQSRRKKRGLWVVFLVPVLVGTIFKYMLLVPLPIEGLWVHKVSDTVFYTLFSSKHGNIMDGVSEEDAAALNDAF
ncbi:tripartite tricarboxylate transporter TctB family protein [Alginatibacterium sediminis]|uniref:Tripartite tricarboxylate transporter TctB family protein n=1 Tax=Alginatibacterium sediminis TaxID=2164068 RepID=A0A420EI83_9ALTE|nr:tripartite tricarboxylate transporter TctB family protein [Alginatibacterium sediminis]RKF20276.1 tripartite tricarboxylate transporter TctB family protein [Alginatibacterium sediminis]